MQELLSEPDRASPCEGDTEPRSVEQERLFLLCELVFRSRVQRGDGLIMASLCIGVERVLEWSERIY